MEITHELMLDLQRTGVRQTIYAKRGDSLTRTAKIRLFDGGTEFTVPAGATMQIAYAKSDGKGGLYDTMPDKSSACAASGNIVTAKLHPQMFTVSGLVACELRILTGSGEQLSTFTWFIAVQPSATDGCKSEDYYNFATLNGIMENIGDLGDLNTSVKNSLVAAINSVYSTVDTISKRYIVGVNGIQRDVSGNVEIAAEDINAQVAEINYQGDVQGALAALATIATMPSALPVARASSGDGIAYTATDADSGCTLPTVSVADNMSQISAVGKGRQIVFIPYAQNASNAPTLRLNGGGIIPIRMRAPRNQSDNGQSPDATLPVPVGALMRGVPYTMTFCGKYWLVDSMPYSGRVDITAEYAAWTPENGTAKTVANYAKTLTEGGYRIADVTIGRYEIEVFAVVNGQQWRILREYTDEFCYISVYCGETLSMYIDTETGYVQVGGRTMLTDDNIPLPTAADIGKVLTATAGNRGVWTAVTNAEEVAV